MKQDIRFLVMDVDGTLTDGKIYMGPDGEVFKVFDIKDGSGIKDILPQYHIIPVIITARTSRILEKRCRELDIDYLFQGIRNKMETLSEVMRQAGRKDGAAYTLKNVAYIGDDLLDLQCMEPIKKAEGIIGCPQDASKAVTEMADYICCRRGGDGAVREFIEWLTQGR